MDSPHQEIGQIDGVACAGHGAIGKARSCRYRFKRFGGLDRNRARVLGRSRGGG